MTKTSYIFSQGVKQLVGLTLKQKILKLNMASDAALFEKDVNVLIKEYLSFVGLDKTLYSLQLECTEKGKPIPAGNEAQRDGSKLAAQVPVAFLLFCQTSFPLTFHLLHKCQKWCERSELNVKMPEFLRRSRSVATIFCSNFGFLQKKRKKIKKGHRSERSANILAFYRLDAVNKGLVP